MNDEFWIGKADVDANIVRRPAVMMRALVFAAAVSSAAATLELTPDTFDDQVHKSGKSAFIKFFAPWCGHCKKMKPDWDTLATEYDSSDKVLIADVDCTAAGKPLCDKYGVKGFPTIKYFNPPDEEGEDYKGGRSLSDLKKFAAELGPGCSVDAMENCSDEQKAELQTYIDMSADNRAKMLEDLKTELKTAEETHDALLKDLQATYKESMDKVEALKEASAPKIKMLKAATPSGKEEAVKDEM